MGRERPPRFPVTPFDRHRGGDKRAKRTVTGWGLSEVFCGESVKYQISPFIRSNERHLFFRTNTSANCITPFSP
jgi:hypothetical protein